MRARAARRRQSIGDTVERVASLSDTRLFVVAPPGLEEIVYRELQALPVGNLRMVSGGVELEAHLRDLVLINSRLRTAVRVLLRVGAFRAVHLSELSRRARALPWQQYVRPGQGVSVKATCHASAIYHSGAAAERVRDAIYASCGVPPAAAAPVAQVLVRLERNNCTISLDTSGEPLYRRGYKLDVGKAPMRENLAAGILQWCGWRHDEPLIDLMCGSGTFALEAASMRAGLNASAWRRFACAEWPVCATAKTRQAPPPAVDLPPILAFDRNAGAITATCENAARAGIASHIRATQASVSAVRASGSGGLVVCNAPYGERIGDAKALRNLYAAVGNLMRGALAGWRLALVTSNPRLAWATGLQFDEVSPPLPHGGLKIKVYCYRASRDAAEDHSG